MTKPPRICLDARPALLGRGGIARATAHLAAALARRDDVELRLFGHSLSAARQRSMPPAGARLHRLPIPGRALPTLARLGLAADALAGRPAVFHWTDYIHPPVRRRCKVVLTVHDLAFAHDASFHGEVQARELGARTARAIARADRVVAPSHATAHDVRERFPRSRVEVIPFGGDHVPPAPAGPSPHPRPFYLAVGTIEPRKNHLALLAAWDRLPEPRPDLVVVGARGWECDAIVAALRARRSRGVTWLERAPDEQTFALLRHAIALVYPSKLEGFGFPPLEAMASGTPCICGDTPALRELAGDAARFAAADDVDDVAAAMTALHRDPALRAALTERGLARATQFSWDECAARHARVYRTLVEESP